MAIIKKFSSYQNLSNYNVLVNDTNPNSDYFRITEFKETFTGGKNAFLIEGSPFLKETTEVKIEILDVEGNPVYYEPGDGIPEYYEGLSKVVSVHVYPDTPIGLGKITILGEAKQYVDSSGVIRDVPDDWKGAYNVKWERNFQINRNLQNETIVRFYKRPQVNITEIVKPIFNKTIPTKTISGSVSGEPIQPGTGTNLLNWGAGTLYRLTLSSGSWDKDIDENPINITVNGTSFTPTIIEVLNNSQVLVDVPYTENNIVQPFTSQSFTASFLDFENEIPGESSLTGSFGKIDLTQLKTFAGDVARVKVYRRSRNEVGDFQFVQESRLESTELLRDINVSDAVEIPYGNFSDSTLNNYWTTSSTDSVVSIDSSVLSQAVKVDYSGSSTQLLITSESFNISKDVEYEISFKTLLSGSATTDKFLRAFLTGSYTNTFGTASQYEQNFVFISGSDIFKTRQTVSQNILAERDVTASLAFEFKGDDWYLSNVSLKNAQETSFSPDEFTLIQSIPRKLEKETFDFRFEFYDINNNYIPVDVTATKEFDGGNDYVVGGTSARILTFESDRNAFRYASSSASPEDQTIILQSTKTNLTGSISYSSGAFDQGGNLITSSISWSVYPGQLTNITDSPSGGSATLTVSNFEGSWVGSIESRPEVYSIIYTASVEDLQEFETVFRVEDGDNAPQLLVTSNANQFIYEPTTLSPKPSGQSITIRAQRKNLESLSTVIAVNKSTPFAPDLVEGSDTGGVKTYTVSATAFSASFADNNFDEVTYSFTGSDIFGNPQSDEITISKVINFDAISVTLSNEHTAFRANGQGVVLDDFGIGDGVVEVRVGDKEIQHDNGLTVGNRFDILSGSAINVTQSNPSYPNSSYGISAMSEDSGSLTLNIKYLAGDGVTSQTFNKKVNYSKNKIASPLLTIQTTNKDQSVTAFSTGEQLDLFENSVVTIKEQYTGSVSSLTLDDLTATSDALGTLTTVDNRIILNNQLLDSGSNNTTILVTATVTDSEGTQQTLTDTISLSKVKNAPPTTLITVNPQSQTVQYNSGSFTTPVPVSVNVVEGNSSYVYVSEPTASLTYTVTGVVNGTNNNDGTIQPSTPIETSSLSGQVQVSFTNSEGVSSNGAVDFNVGIAVQGVNGESGSDGVTGPGVVFRGEWNGSTEYFYQESVVDNIGRRDAVIYNDVYYATLQTNTNKQPDIETDFWEELGTDSFFVAAEIIISRNSFVEEVLNVGQRGGDANIAIVGGDNTPYISIAQSGSQGYGNTGIFTGVSSGPTGLLSLVGNSGYLLWDGDNLSISGDLNFSNGDTISQDGTFSLGGGNITYDSSTLSVSGSINATAGTIGGFTIGSNTLTTTGFTIGDRTQTYALNASDNFTVTHAGAVQASNVNITGGGININNGVFSVDSNGSLVAQNAIISGSINAEDGTIGGWIIGTTTLTGGGVTLNSAGSVSAGDVTLQSNSVTINGAGSIDFTGVGSLIGEEQTYTPPTGVGNVTIDTITSTAKFYANAGGVAIGDWFATGNLSGGSITSVGTIVALSQINAVGNITSIGNIIAFVSDERLKTRYSNITDPLIKIKKLNGFEYTFNDIAKSYGYNDNKLHVGVSAQEIEEVLPHIVQPAPFDFDEETKKSKSGENYKTVQYEKIVPLLIEGIKELTQKVEDLEKEIFKLKGK